MKTTRLFFMAALALMTAACSNDDNEMTQQPQKARGITITAQLAPKTDGATTRAVEDKTTYIEAKWAKNEHLAILYEVGGTKKVADAEITAVDGSGTATITFTVDGGTTNDTPCTLVYPLSAAKDDHTGVKDAATLLAAQDGTLNANLDVRVGEGTIQTTTPGLTVTTQPEAQFAIFKLTLKDIDGANNVSATSVIVSDQIGTVTTVTPASGYDKVMYVALPTTATTLKFAVTDGTTNYFNMASGLSLGTNFYQSTIKLATVGDVIMSTSKCAKAGTAGAVAMIAYLGNASDCVNGLAIALEDVSSSSLRWDNSGSKNGGKTAAEWCNAWNESTSPNKVTGGTWRLPTIIDWQNIIIGCGTSGTAVADPRNTYMKYNGLTSYLSAAGGVTLTSFYWSSTEVNVNYAMDLNFTGGSDGALFTQSSKTGECGVRACLAF